MINNGIKDELTKLIGEVCTVEVDLGSQGWTYLAARGVLSHCDGGAFRIVCEHTSENLARFVVDDVEQVMQVGKSVKDIRLTGPAVAS